MTNIELYATIALAVLLIADIVVFLVYYTKLKRFMKVTDKRFELTDKIGKTELEMLDLHQEHLEKHDKLFTIIGETLFEKAEDIKKSEDSKKEDDDELAQFMIDKLLELAFAIGDSKKSVTENAHKVAKNHKKRAKNEK